MNTKHLKNYAPKARRQFIQAVENRLAWLGIYPNTVAEVSFQGDSALIEGRVFSRKQAEQRNRLIDRIASRGATGGFAMFVREMAYTWFNRLAAIRFMELKGYLEHGYRVLSSKDGSAGLPEILDYAADVADLLQLNKKQMIELQLAGNQQEKLYRELLLGQCHYLHAIMPFMFEALDDATELLLPDNLTKTDSILKGLVEEIPEHDWQNIEVIGWLYQFYISEHKDAVIGKVVKSEDIPAATQLFTPNWIVKYLVQNSVGRQWLQTYPDSAIKAQMEYYIGPGEQPAEVIAQLQAHTPASIEPESIKVLDPACGSGHILVEVYELLREIYLERGYRLRDIPQLILTKNIFGLDIDDRAAQLSGFALMMKAREDDRRIFDRIKNDQLQLNIFALQQTDTLEVNKLWQALNLEGKQQRGSSGDLFGGLDDVLPQVAEPTQHSLYHQYFTLLQYLKAAFAQAKTLGSLVPIEHSKLEALQNVQALLQEKLQGTDPAAKQAAEVLMPIVQQAIVLADKYDNVIANPPYMGQKYMNKDVKSLVNLKYPLGKSDLFSVYILRCIELSKRSGKLGLLTPYVWMFLSSYEKLRTTLLKNNTITSLVQLEYNAFAPACIPVCIFTLDVDKVDNFTSSFIRLSDFKGHENQGPKTLEAIKNKSCSWLHRANPSSFSLIPGSPLAYWIPSSLPSKFSLKSMGDISSTNYGIITGENARYVRYWWEVSNKNIYSSGHVSKKDGFRWVKYNKGGPFRRWYGNCLFVVDWAERGQNFVNVPRKIDIPEYQSFLNDSLTWSDITSAGMSMRYLDKNVLTDSVSPTAQFENEETLYCSLAFLNSNVAEILSKVINPTMHFKLGDFEKIFYKESIVNGVVLTRSKRLVEISKQDWDKSEISWDFESIDLLNNTANVLRDKYSSLILEYAELLDEFGKLEVENNKNINSILEISDVSSDCPKDKLTLSINPSYVYSGQSEGFDIRFRSEICTNFIQNVIGQMMGRYSLDKPGLILASQGETLQDYLNQIPNPRFMPDSDAILPLTDQEWFADDVTNRVREFVKVVWGEETLQENLTFIAESLCLHAIKGKKSESAIETIRRYLSSQFYKDHLKTYKKRPIYWLFSSGKEKAFECLVYLHRYNESTLARMRTEYVTPLMGKYDAQHSLLLEQKTDASPAQQREFEKELKALEKKQTELRAFDEQLKHYADMRIKLDLDDGVKVNYGKFGNLLAEVKAITGDKE